MQQAQPNGQVNVENRVEQAAKLLDQILDNTSARMKAVRDGLESRIERIEQVLPHGMRGQGARLVKRAMLTFGRSEKLQSCTVDSFITCVLSAAELGLAVDGRLGHAVPYRNKKSGMYEAQFQPDYKGLIAIARRNKHIADVFADVVCEGDEFDHGKRDGKCYLNHTYSVQSKRTTVVAAYAVIRFRDDNWRYELMTADELVKIKARSKSKDRDGNVYGPWVTDEWEMFKKTVAKRALKTYCDDPVLEHAMHLDDREYEDHHVPKTARGEELLSRLKKPEPVVEPEAEPELADAPHEE